jgi:hypothetical protein
MLTLKTAKSPYERFCRSEKNVEKPVKPNANPESNNFGNGVKNNYLKVKGLLGL